MESLVYLCRSKLLTTISPCKITLRTFQRRSVKRVFGLPPYKAKSLEQKLDEYSYKDPSVYYKVDIGLPRQSTKSEKTLSERTAYFKKIKEDVDLEKKARKNQLIVNLDDVSAEWTTECGPEHIKAAAEHYGVFEDLFGDAFFYPQVNLDAAFQNGESLVPVYRGNLVKPDQAVSAPLINYRSDPDSLWTLVVTNPDGHLQQENAEYLHWFLGNIPASEVSKGDVVVDYIQPFPARGTGFQRFIFVLYKQTGKIDYSSLKVASDVVDLKQRTFSTYDFYRAHQDQLTPAGLVFCQVDWDLSVSNFFHTVLDMDEPVFEYDFEAPYHPKQKLFPIKQPFNLYMDRYRDPKQIAKEYLLRKLQKRHPFEKPKPPLKYPNTLPVYHDIDERIFGHIPSWLKREKIKSRLGYGRINDY